MSAGTQETIYAGPVDEVTMVLAWHNGNVHTSIGTLLSDLKHPREQLALTEAMMGTGFSHGLKPSTLTAKGPEYAHTV